MGVKMKLKINSINIENFRKFKKYETDFHDSNIIYGKNGSGKTSLIDAISWCLFGKNFEDSTFETNKFNPEGKIQNQDTVVELSLSVDGLPTRIKREYKNNRTSILVDGVPKKVNEFNDYLETNILSADDLKIFINPAHFNSNLHWKEKRKMLMDYFDMPSNEEIVETYNFEPISTFFIKELKNKEPKDIVSKYKNELSILKDKSSKYKAQIEYLEEETKPLDIDIKEQEKKREKLIKEQKDIKEKMDNVYKLSEKKQVLKSKIENAEYTTDNSEYTKLEMKLSNLKNKYHETSNKYKKLEATEIKTKCPTCKQTLPKEQIESVKKEHEEKKNEIVKYGKELKKEIKETKKLLEETPKQKAVKKYSDKEVEKMQKEMDSIKIEFDLTDKYDEINEEISELNDCISGIERHNDNVNKLKSFIKKQKEIAFTIEEFENTVDDAEKFEELRTEFIVDKINDKFDTIQVKIFEELKNGNVKETFEVTRAGVPYDELNSTGKIMAGLELLNFLKKSMKIDIPIVIDNFERYPSIDIDTLGDSQLFLVVASEGKADKLGDFEILTKEDYKGVK
jgi:DNA repair exonuclease SbcCD ATPase subunit